MTVIIIDQLTKAWVRNNLLLGEEWTHSFGPVHIIHVVNSGAAFGILQGQTPFLIITSLLGLGAIVLYYVYPPMEHGLIRVALGMQLGGAIGNLIDRVRVGEVTDFVEVGRFPTFNVADASISVSIVAVLIFFTLQDAGKSAKPPPRPAGWQRRCSPACRRLISSADGSGERLDVFVARRLPELTRSRVKKLIDDGRVTVSGAAREGVAARSSRARCPRRCPSAREACAAARGDPARHPLRGRGSAGRQQAAGHDGASRRPATVGTLVNAILAHCADLSGIGGVLRPGIVHRLDRDTSA